jgi:hypothetical protein
VKGAFGLDEVGELIYLGGSDMPGYFGSPSEM